MQYLLYRAGVNRLFIYIAPILKVKYFIISYFLTENRKIEFYRTAGLFAMK